MKIGAAIFWMSAGAMHFVIPRQYEAIVPPYLARWKKELVVASGIAEIAGAVAILPDATRRGARWWLLATLVAIYPANIHMAVNSKDFPKIRQPRSGRGCLFRGSSRCSPGAERANPQGSDPLGGPLGLTPLWGLLLPEADDALDAGAQAVWHSVGVASKASTPNGLWPAYRVVVTVSGASAGFTGWSVVLSATVPWSATAAAAPVVVYWIRVRLPSAHVIRDRPSVVLLAQLPVPVEFGITYDLPVAGST